MKKMAIVAGAITAFHFVEDLMWVTLGRYTELPFWGIVLAIILIGIGGGALVRHPAIKKFLGD